MLDHKQIHADHGGVAFGDDARDNFVTINDLETIKEAMRQVKAEHIGAEAEQIRQNLDITQEALTTFFKIIDHEQVSTQELGDTLNQIAQRHKQALNGLAALETDDPDNRSRLQLVHENINAGRYDSADQLLQTVEDTELAALRQAQELLDAAKQAVEKRALNAAAARAQRGRLSLTQLHCHEAAKHFMEASELVPDGNPQQIEYLRGARDAYIENFRIDGRHEPKLSSAIEKKLDNLQQASGGQLRARALYELATMQRLTNRFNDAIDTYLRAATTAEDQGLHNLVYDAWLGITRAIAYGTRDHGAAAEAFGYVVEAAGAQPTPKQMYEIASHASELQGTRGELVAALVSAIEAIMLARIDSELFYAQLDAGDVLQKFAESCDYRRLIDAKTYSDDGDPWGACRRAVYAAKAYYEEAKDTAKRLGWEFLVNEAEGFISRLDSRLFLIEQKVVFGQGVKGISFAAQNVGEVEVSNDFEVIVANLSEQIPFRFVAEGTVSHNKSQDPITLYSLGLKADSEGNAEAALEYFRQAVEGLQLERSNYFDPRGQGTCVEDRLEIVHHLAIRLLAMGDFENAFRVLESIRSLGMSELAAAFAENDFNKPQRKLLAELVKIESQMSAIINDLVETTIAGVEHSKSVQMIKKLRSLKQTRIQLFQQPHFQEISKRISETGYVPPTLSELQKLTHRANIPVLLYWVMSSYVIVWIVSPKGTHVMTVSLPEVAVMHKVEKLVESIRTTNRLFDETSARELHTYLIKPFLNYLSEQQVLIVPQGPLVRLPFEALINAETGAFLVEDIAVSYATSSFFAARALKGKLPVVTEITAVFDEFIENNTGEISKIEEDSGLRVVAKPVQGLMPQRVIELLGQGENIHVLLHGTFDYSDPLQSRIMLNNSERSRGNNKITATELLAMDWRDTRLVVLNSSEGAMVGQRISNEMYGLFWPLLIGGVDHVLLNRWRVHEHSSADWMVVFYKTLASGRASPALAAAMAMRRTIAGGRRTPFLWAGPQVFGR